MSESETRKSGRGSKPEGEGEESAPSFRVIDRRRFAPDGSERSEAAEEAARNEEQEERSAPAAEPGRARTPAAERSRADRVEERAGSRFGMPAGEPYGEERSTPNEPTFSTLLISLSTQALMYLGEIPDLQGGGGSEKDLGAARNVIDLIGVLEAKTRGNLDPDESALLERILYDLRMRYVEISRS